jgi:signal transduction histidine kinase
MIYAAVGLGILFVAWGVISRTSIDQVSTLLLEERLATAQSVSAAFSGELHHMRNDLAEDLEGVTTPGADRQSIADDSFNHLVAVDEFTYFEIQGIVVIEEQGEIAAISPSSFTVDQAKDVAYGDIWPLDPFTTFISHSDSVTVVVSIPLTDPLGINHGSAHAFVKAIGSTAPLVGFLPSEGIEGSSVTGTEYHLEVINASGVTILGIGPGLHDIVGEITTHWDLVREVVQSRSQAVVNGRDSDGATALAVVPIIGTEMYLLAMRENDVSISAPARLQDLFVLIGIVGFIGAMLVVAVTTRKVVQSTSELTAAAERMAQGDLESPVSVSAQDEIAQLAESIESMRVQLSQASDQALRSNQELERRVAERTDQLRRALEQVISAQEAERKRVARDLHDGIAQDVIVLTRNLESARQKLKSGDMGSDYLDELITLARKSLDSTREISRALRPSMLDDLGLVPALNWAANELEKRSNIEVEVHVDNSGFESEITDEQALLLFRVAQEAFANIDRHSKATDASLSLERSGGELRMTISDNGKGFEMPESMRELAVHGHLGLIGMLERIELAGGTLVITSRTDGARSQQNTVVTASVPVFRANTDGNSRNEGFAREPLTRA